MFLARLRRGGVKLTQTLKRNNNQKTFMNTKRYVNTGANPQVPTQSASTNTVGQTASLPNVGQSTKGWTYLSPNIAIYKAQIGSMFSIGIRALLIWNVSMLIFEVIFYPYNIFDILLNRKIE
jgi:hypothetical protein